jgi:hypothetical protein
MSEISKRNLFSMSREQIEAGRKIWQQSGKVGRLANSSMDAEATAPKTWILWKNAAKGEPEAIIECEIHTIGRASDHREGLAMLHGMCPVCSETFIVREDNKSMSLGWLEYSKLRAGHLKEQWERHCREVLRRMPRDQDKIAVVSSPERWMCDYCKNWCVRVTDSVAITDKSGATQIIVPMMPKKRDEIAIATEIKKSETVL